MLLVPCLSARLSFGLLAGCRLGSLLAYFDSVSVCACLSIFLSVCPSVCLSVSLSVCLSVCLSVSLSVCLPACLSVWFCLPVTLCARLLGYADAPGASVEFGVMRVLGREGNGSQLWWSPALVRVAGLREGFGS